MVLHGSSFFRVFTWEWQRLLVGKVFYSSSFSFPGPSPGRDQPQLPITCDITEGAASAEYRTGSLPQWGESVSIASSSSCIIQLEPIVQPATFALSTLTDQGAATAQSPFSLSPPSLLLLFLLSYLCYSFVLPFSFLCPSVMWSSSKGLKIQIGCVNQLDRLEVPCRNKRGHVRCMCSSQRAHASCKCKFKG